MKPLVEKIDEDHYKYRWKTPEEVEAEKALIEKKARRELIIIIIIISICLLALLIICALGIDRHAKPTVSDAENLLFENNIEFSGDVYIIKSDESLKERAEEAIGEAEFKYAKCDTVLKDHTLDGYTIFYQRNNVWYYTKVNEDLINEKIERE